ncbi:hypothetical protein DERP_009240 [Dermatophagoides pteronyssinus]|uniref:Uncharacterized protein n=1 Tax=Dermatophagoides pteronyssinus TaxID=6956 RepID=A0ABQ8JQX4_DERPT|nr:hypothetical protein DERP_009240 [Dermatophagoides pteronyssinus]
MPTKIAAITSRNVEKYFATGITEPVSLTNGHIGYTDPFEPVKPVVVLSVVNVSDIVSGSIVSNNFIQSQRLNILKRRLIIIFSGPNDNNVIHSQTSPKTYIVGFHCKQPCFNNDKTVNTTQKIDDNKLIIITIISIVGGDCIPYESIRFSIERKFPVINKPTDINIDVIFIIFLDNTRQLKFLSSIAIISRNVEKYPAAGVTAPASLTNGHIGYIEPFDTDIV